VDLAEALGDPRALLDALHLSMFGALYAGELPAGPPARVEQLARAAGPVPAHEDPRLGLAAVDLARGDARSAVGRLELVYRQAVEQGNELGLALAATVLARAELARAAGRGRSGWRPRRCGRRGAWPARSR
jgi:hypothetical protein